MKSKYIKGKDDTIRSIGNYTCLLFFVGLFPILGCQPDPLPAQQEAAQIRQFMDSYLYFGSLQAISLGVITPDEQYILHGGVRDLISGLEPEDHSLYEIGGLSQSFTGVLYSDLLISGHFQEGDLLSRYWPRPIDQPNLKLNQLVTHSAGIPTDFGTDLNTLSPNSRALYFANFSHDDLEGFVQGLDGALNPGLQYQLSYPGISVLARAMEIRMGQPYTSLIQDRIGDALGLEDTRELRNFNQNRADRLVNSLHPDGHLLPLYQFGEYQGGESLISSPAEMMLWLRAQLDPFSVINDAIQLSQQGHYELGQGLAAGYGWLMYEDFGYQVYTASGQTHMAAIMRFVPEAGTGIFILTNSPNLSDVKNLADEALQILLD